MDQNTKRYKLIACEILFREVCYCVSRSPHIIDITFMPKALHDIGETKMLQQLQQEVDKVDPSLYDALLLVYGLCNNGIRGLKSKLPMIIPRAHDCITLLMGSKETYKSYFVSNPGTYFLSTGWMERNNNYNDNKESVTSQLGISCNYDDYVKVYGEENAKFLYETLGDWVANYKKYTYIDNGIGDFKHYKEQAKQEASGKNWEYEEITGKLDLFTGLVNGNWDPGKFLTVPPDKTVLPSYNDDIIHAE